MHVVAYCRVSTDQQDQLNSFESQKRFFKRYIDKKQNWELVNVYADEGITGTNIEKREQFKKMINDARQNNFDMIITKEISRFARNTVDCLVFVRELKALQIGIYFMIEDIFSLDDDAEYKITQYAMNAQEESHKTSRRVTWGIVAKMEEGFVFGNRVYGYELKNGVLTINENEAKVIRLIFNLYLNEGLGVRRILKYLEDNHYLSPKLNTTWEKTSILRFLQNEKYTGILKQRKEITIDYLSHKRVKNDGIEDFIIIENHHEAIISPEVFNAVQIEIKRRGGMIEDKAKYSNKYCFSAKIKCSQCGSTFTRRHWNGKKEQNSIVWQCKENVKNGLKKTNELGIVKGCNNKGIHDIYLKELFLSAFNNIVDNKQAVIDEVKNAVMLAISQKTDNSKEISNLTNEISKIRVRKVRLLELYADSEVDKKMYIDANKQYDVQLEKFQSELSELQEVEKSKIELEQKLEIIDKTIQKLVCCQEFSDSICSEVLERVEVYSREKISFFCK